MTRKGAEFWWNLNRKEKIIIPPEVALYSRDHVNEDWKITTWKDIFALRKQRQQSSLNYKRRCEISKIKHCLIWVFYNNSWLYGGWWIYIKTLKKDYALNFKNDRPDLVMKIMTMFPCGIIPLKENFYQWAESFAKEYHSDSFKRKIQGLKMCKCEIDGHANLKDIIK